MMRAGLLVIALLLLLPQAAHAQLRLCNRTSHILYAATSQVQDGSSQTQGWTRLAPGDCQVALKAPLNAQSTMVYARSALAHSGPQRAWGGNFPLCVRDTNFTLRQTVITPRCDNTSNYTVPFAAIATHSRTDFVMNFDEQPALPSLAAAQLAGVKRLLQDNGFKVGAIDGTPDKATGQALQAFRARMKFAPNAGNVELFAALEAQALKTAVPAGYTVCNDRKEELLVAMGEKGKAPTSRGWWRIAPGACARTITAPLAADSVWLLAQKTDGTVVVGGPERFCVTPKEFEMGGNCTGASQSGFARTVTRGANGYIARIGAKGLLPR